MQTAQQENISWHDICAVNDIPKDTGVAALIDDHQIAVFSIGKEPQVFAIGNYDPFSNANVLARGIVGSIGDVLVVAAPIYKQHFDLTTGKCLEDETVSVASHPVRIDNGRVFIGLTV